MGGATPADTCTGNQPFRDKLTEATFEVVPYTPEDPTHRCHDCNIAPGGKHHPGCDMERCPKCGGQLISCGCEIVAVDPTQGAVIEAERAVANVVLGRDGSISQPEQIPIAREQHLAAGELILRPTTRPLNP